MSKCPRCFRVLPLDDFAWYRRGDSATSIDPVATRYVGRDVLLPQVHTDTPDPDSDDQVPLCPKCHFELRPEWYGARVTTVVVTGARATGKTVYIAVMIKVLQAYLDKRGRAVVPANSSTDVDYRDTYEKPLYVERGMVQATPSSVTGQREPLLFALGPGPDGVPHYLAIRDVAGEDLETPEKVESLDWGFFGLADTVLFLFDPLSVEEIRHQLQDHVPAPDRLGGDPRVVLQTVMRLIGQGDPQLGIVLSKFDSMQALHRHRSHWGAVMANPGAAFNRDPMLSLLHYDEVDGRLLHEEIRSLLAKLRAGALLLNAQNPAGRSFRHRFFAVSALGEAPEGGHLHQNGIAPFRVLDPVFWTFGSYGV